MKFVIFLCFASNWAVFTSGLLCWECENAISQQECLNRGALVECQPTQNTCQLTLRHGGWGDYPIIEKSCKQLSACGNNHIQDSHEASVFLVEDTQCTMKPPSSVCRCCCSTDGCNQYIETCGAKLGGLPCPPVFAPDHGSMVCRGGFDPQSECRFECEPGYNMVGSSTSRCNLFSVRDYPSPTCEKPPIIRCHPLEDQLNGGYECTMGQMYLSECSFTCNEGYKLEGATMLKCILDMDGDDFGTWSRVQPRCRPLQCPPQVLKNGEVNCSSGFEIGTICSFSCNNEYQLVPSTTNNNFCQRNEKWSRRTPCCNLPCPPFALMDFAVILDSSSSVGSSNWVKMKSFVRSFLRVFTVRDDATHFAIIRYNAEVDRNTQILFNDHPNSIEGVLQAFDRIPYDGSGTRTGKALNYTAMTLLDVGNRPNAVDVVLLITDGASQDDVVIASNNLHNTGALVFVLPVAPPRGRLDLDEIDIIARFPDNVIRDALDGGFDALDEAFARRISQRLCSIPCQ